MLKKSLRKALDKINNGWVRFAVFIIVGINTGAMLLGYDLLPFDNQEIVNGASFVAMIVSEVWNHYKNNDYTPEAKHATNYMEAMKQEHKSA
ncbi:hypothetical protein GCM10028778_08030 [Barrientosiimonas marina]|uniref:Phage holin n=1 Tax=Lentibacillus kimchii TaxID=1542911 RepID=A0ABW2UU05_9BACI